MRSLVAAALAAALAASPAAAQSPPPTVLSFDDADLPGQYTATLVEGDAGCAGTIFNSRTVPRSAPSFLFAPCRPTLRITFTTPKASVQLFARALVASAQSVVVTGHTVTGQTTTVTVNDPSTWKPVSLTASESAFDYVELRAEGADVGVDDLAISTAPQPDSALTGGPPARTDLTQAMISFQANRPDVAGYRCELNGAPVTPCTSPMTLTNLQQGAHRFTVATIDAYGAIDPSPAEYVWTVLGPPPDTPIAPGATPVVSGDSVTIPFATPGEGMSYECSVDGGSFTPCTPPFTASGLAPGPHTLDVRAVDADGRADPTPERFAFVVPAKPSGISAETADADKDGIVDSQDTLPAGNVPPVAGVRTVLTLLSGTVYVKLPATRPLQQLPGFVPLKGIAALPIGTVVDARRGTIAIETARDGRPATDPRRRLGRATLSQAIFQIRQARARRAAQRTRQIPTSFVLASAPQAERGCRSRVPIKGVVRTFQVRANGLFRVSGGASRAEGGTATWHTTDRCTGTTTRVTRGKVTVYDKARRRTVTVRAGARYVARARLFQAKKGRG